MGHIADTLRNSPVCLHKKSTLASKILPSSYRHQVNLLPFQRVLYFKAKVLCSWENQHPGECHQHIFLSSSTVQQRTASTRGSHCWFPWLHGRFTLRACRSCIGTCCRACRLSRMYTHTLFVFQWCWNAHAGPFEHTHTIHYLHMYSIVHLSRQSRLVWTHWTFQ